MFAFRHILKVLQIYKGNLLIFTIYLLGRFNVTEKKHHSERTECKTDERTHKCTPSVECTWCTYVFMLLKTQHLVTAECKKSLCLASFHSTERQMEIPGAIGLNFSIKRIHGRSNTYLCRNFSKTRWTSLFRAFYSMDQQKSNKPVKLEKQVLLK